MLKTRLNYLYITIYFTKFMNQYLLIFILVFSSTLTTYAQVVYTEPAFPTVDDAVTIYFDATQGTGGLEDCNCTVYIHTGVITNESTTPSDWKHVAMQWGVENPDWALTRVVGEENLYTFEITPSIREYYNIGDNEIVEKMAFAFRNGNGSLEGKDVGGADIFYMVYDSNMGFTSSIQSPSQHSLIKEIGEIIEINAVSSTEATLTLTDNGQELASIIGTALSYDLVIASTGTHIVEFTANDGEETQVNSFTYVVPENKTPIDPPVDYKDGITIIGDSSIYLQLYAPEKNYVFVIGSFNNWNFSTDYQLNISQDRNTHWILINGLNANEIHTFQYLVEGDIKIADPYSTLVLDPFNDPFIAETTYPNLPEYPTGKTTGIVSLVELGAPEYQWQVNDFERPEQEKLVIYELLIRDFVENHDYRTLIDTLDYLERLGVNAIELMPVNEFEGNISWGYNPSFHMALDKYYGTINDFKNFIDECHRRGIAVILDVVYNHAFSQSPLVQLYLEGGEPASNNPWFNSEATHPFNVGFDFNHESPATKKFMKQVMTYWLEEFRIDGFRFDLSKGFTQTNHPNDVGAWSQYDASRISILKDYMDTVWETTSGAYNILEHFAENEEETALIEYGAMVWGNMNHNYNEATMGYIDNDIRGTSHLSRNWEKRHLISYMESHDEQRLMYRNKEFGSTSNPDHNVKEENIGLHRNALASVFFYTIPGPKMLWQFGELGYDFDINLNGRTGSKPIRWDYYNEFERRRLYHLTSALIHLRNEYEVFCTDDVRLDISSQGIEGDLKKIQLNGTDMQVNILGNFTVFPQEIKPDFQATGTWYEYFSGEELNIEDLEAKLSLEAGEYRLYTSVRLPEPSFGYTSTVSAKEVRTNDFKVEIYPNPTSSSVDITFYLTKKEVVEVAIYNLTGQLIKTLWEGEKSTGLQSIALNKKLLAGTYFVKIKVGNQVKMKKLVVL